MRSQGPMSSSKGEPLVVSATAALTFRTCLCTGYHVTDGKLLRFASQIQILVIDGPAHPPSSPRAIEGLLAIIHQKTEVAAPPSSNAFTKTGSFYHLGICQVQRNQTIRLRERTNSSGIWPN